jgi:PKD repeat protein
MRDFAVRPDSGSGRRHALRALVVALVVLAATVLGAGFALAAQGDVQCNGVLNGGTPNDPIGKVVSSPHDNPATTAIEAYAGDVVTYTVTWPPNGANKATVLDCLVTDPVIAADGSLTSYNTDAAAVAAMALVTITDTSGSLGALGTDLGFEQVVDPNSGTYIYSMVMPATLVGHTFANRAKVEGTNESKSNFVVVSVITPPVVTPPNVAPTVTCPAMSINDLAVGFTASGSDSDGTITNYHWVFGDGDTADTAGNTVSHTYAAGGSYPVSVTVTDDDGATGSSSGTCAATVAAPVVPPPNVAPTVACPAMSANALAVSYTASATDSDGTIANYHWAFGDGQTADTSGSSTTHSYAAAGTYSVTVTVTDDDGATASSSGPCSITVAPALTPAAPPPADDDDDVAPTVVLAGRRSLPRTGTDARLLVWIAAAMLFGGALLRGVKPRPVRLVYAGRGLVAEQVAQYGLTLAATATPIRNHAFRKM